MSVSILQNYLTPREAADRLGKSYPSVCRYMSDGTLPAIEDRGRKYIPVEAVENFQEPPKGNPNFRKQNKNLE